MADLNTFAKNIRELGRRVEVNTAKEKRKTAAVVQQIVTLGTPVKTGRARNNWDVGLGEPWRATTQEVDPSGAGAVARNNAKIATTKPGQDIYISNNLPYINRLNQGSSSQAPAGFVEEAVALGSQSIANARVLKR